MWSVPSLPNIVSSKSRTVQVSTEMSSTEYRDVQVSTEMSRYWDVQVSTEMSRILGLVVAQMLIMYWLLPHFLKGYSTYWQLGYKMNFSLCLVYILVWIICIYVLWCYGFLVLFFCNIYFILINYAYITIQIANQSWIMSPY